MTRLSDEHAGGLRLDRARPDAGRWEIPGIGRSQVLKRPGRTCRPSQREVIRLKFQNGFSYREISRISGHSVTRTSAS